MTAPHLVDKAVRAFRRTMPIRIRVLVFVTVGLLSSLCSSGQEQRPSLIPMQQGGAAGPNASASSSAPGLTDQPMTPGEIVHISVFDAPDFSITARVSETGDIPYPIIGPVHFEGLNSAGAAALIAKELKDQNLILNPSVTVTVDSATTGITILGEVRAPGIYSPPGKHLLSDLLATAGGLTANTGRVIEISNPRDQGKKAYLSWDPTMHNTDNFDRPMAPGDRVLVRACGIAYVGGNVMKPGAYSLCGSEKMTLSEVIALAGGIAPNAKDSHTYLVRGEPDGTKVVQFIDVGKVLRSKIADPIVREDDIIYVSPSPMKVVLKGALAFALTISPAVLYYAHP